MGRMPCCEKDSVKRGQWTPEEDAKLITYVKHHGTRNWRLIPKHAGLQRCGKSCRLRWTNYLRPDLKHGEFSDDEEHIIVKLHAILGNRWSMIAQNLPGRTDNDVKNHWNTKMKKKLSNMGIDPVTHKPFSHLMAEIASTFAPPQVAHLAEAALGCFKDEMLHLLTKKRLDHIQPLPPPPPPPRSVSVAVAEIRVPDYPDSSSSSSSLTSQSSVLYDAQHMSADVAGNFATPQSQSPPPPPRMNFADAAVSAGGAIFPFGSPSSSSWYGNPLNTDPDTGGVVVVNAGNDCDSSEGSHGAVASASAAAATFFGSDSVLWDLSDDFINPLP